VNTLPIELLVDDLAPCLDRVAWRKLATTSRGHYQAMECEYRWKDEYRRSFPEDPLEKPADWTWKELFAWRQSLTGRTIASARNGFLAEWNTPTYSPWKSCLLRTMLALKTHSLYCALISTFLGSIDGKLHDVMASLAGPPINKTPRNYAYGEESSPSQYAVSIVMMAIFFTYYTWQYRTQRARSANPVPWSQIATRLATLASTQIALRLANMASTEVSEALKNRLHTFLPHHSEWLPASVHTAMSVSSVAATILNMIFAGVITFKLWKQENNTSHDAVATLSLQSAPGLFDGVTRAVFGTVRAVGSSLNAVATCTLRRATSALYKKASSFFCKVKKH